MSGLAPALVRAPNRRMRAARAAAVGTMMALYLLATPYAALHLDIARDLFIALRIVQGQEYPLLGPLLASTVKLGPVWYYLLAGLLAATGSVFATLFAVAVLGALQFPLAYLAGKALHSRAAGLLWGVALLLPSWSGFEQVFPMHTQLAAALALAFVVCAARFVRSGARRYWFGLALAFALALHAHPSTLGLAWIGLGVLVLGWHRRTLRVADVLGAIALAAVPFAPFLVEQVLSGFELFRAAGGYLAGERTTGTLADALPLLATTLGGGLAYWLHATGGWSGWPLYAALAVAAAVQGIGLALWFTLAGDAKARAGVYAGLSAIAAVLLTTALLRAQHPYYMTTTLRVLLAGAIGIGLARLALRATGRGLLALLVGGVLALNLAATGILAHAQTRGRLPIAFFPLFDVGRTGNAHVPMLLMPVYALARSGAFLCAGRPLALHGTYGERIVHGYAIEARLNCDGADLAVGGTDPAREHWAGFSRGLLREMGLKPHLSLGPVGLVRVRRVIGSPAGFVPPGTPVYPPLAGRFGDSRVLRFEATLSAGEYLAVTNQAFGMADDPVVAVRLDGRVLAPATHDLVGAVYACDGCVAGRAHRVDIEAKASDPDRLDIVVF